MMPSFTLPTNRLTGARQPNYLQRALLRAEIVLEFSAFYRLQQLAKTLSLVQLLKIQPKFIYKYLSPYTARSFSRPMRLAAILNHYQFLVKSVAPDFFTALSHPAVLWQQASGPDHLSITLSYPMHTPYEGELSLNFCVNDIIVQVISFVIVPGQLVGSTSEQALFICQVQGTRNALLLRQATKAMHDSTPATLLVHAAHGLASALGIRQLVGISTEEQLCRDKINFDYASFWQQFDGQRTAANLFLLAGPNSEKPIQQIKSNHRARTLRKRQCKQQLRATVAQEFAAVYMIADARR